MKKLILALFTIFLLSCSSDGINNNFYSQLERIDITASFDEDMLYIANFSNGDKLIKVTTNYNCETIYTYDNDRIVKVSALTNGEVSSSITFNYDDIGRVISVHDFKAQHTPQHQDRIITWTDNKMIVPVLWDIENRFELTFNDENLLINHKYITQFGEIGFNFNYEYDGNENMVRRYGEKWSYNFNIATFYDDKNNPFYPFFKKYQIVNMILSQGVSLDRSMHRLGKNNILNSKNLMSGEFIDGYYVYEYSGNTTTQSILKSTEDPTFEYIIDFTYDDD